MSELEKLIADSIERVTLEEAQKKAKLDAEEDEYVSLRKEAAIVALSQIDERDRVPPALLPYTEPTTHLHLSGNGRERDIETLRNGWKPDGYKITAPGLAPITFTLRWDWDEQAKKYR